jgi:hypothetical protein
MLHENFNLYKESMSGLARKKKKNLVPFSFRITAAPVLRLYFTLKEYIKI